MFNKVKSLFKKKKPTIEDCFDFVHNPIDPKDEFYCIKLITGEFKGLVYKYRTIKIDIIDENDNVNFHYTYDVLKKPADFNIDEFSEKKYKRFETLLGDIALKIFVETDQSNVDRENRNPDN